MRFFDRLFGGSKSSNATAMPSPEALKANLSADSSSILQEGDAHWWGPGSMWSASTSAGETVTSQNLMASATCFACTKALSETTAGLPGFIYRGMVNDKKEIDNSQPAWELLVDQPNAEMDSFTFWEIAVTRIINAGNFFAEIQRDGSDRPVALWPIHPSRVRPVRDTDDGSLFWEIHNDFTGAADYADPSWRRQNLKFLSPHNMLNIVGFGSHSGIMSPGVLPGVEEIGVDFATRRYGANFFSSGATPVGIVEHPGMIQKEEHRNMFRADLNRIHNNKNNAHGIGVLWQGAKYNQISVSPEQAQFLETRRYSADQICKLYGVPPAIVGDYKDSKFSTADAMIRAFVMLTLRNLVERIERAVYRQVLNVRAPNGRLQRAFAKPVIYKLALDGLLRGDPKSQAETLQIYRNIGVYSANQVLEELDQNSIEGPEGDFRIIPGGFSRLDKIDNQGTRLDQAGRNDKAEAPEQESDDASLPNFSRERLANQIIESGLADSSTSVSVTGYSPSDALKDTVVMLANDAVDRIHGITLTQVERWKSQDPADVAKKLSGFWDKQHARLLEAMAPCDKVAEKIKQGTVLSTVIANAYVSSYSKLDNYSVFGILQSPLALNAETLIEVELCCS